MIKFLAFTDLHYDYATQGDERIRQIVSRAKDEEVDFIVSLGDGRFSTSSSSETNNVTLQIYG